MKKLWLTMLLLLAVVSIADEKPLDDQPFIIVIKEEIKLQREYDTLYEGGCPISSSVIICVENIKVVEKMYLIIQALLDSAHNDGVNLKINSSYRSYNDQVHFRKKYLRRAYKKYRDSLDFIVNAESKYFYPITGRPGHSKHQNGIAFDFNTKDKEVYKWLIANGIQYGFVRTIEEEKWHWEYHPEITDPYFYVCKEHYSWRIKNDSITHV